MRSRRGAGADRWSIFVAILIGVGFVLGFAVGRWWALGLAACVGIWIAAWEEIEIPGWYYGLASAAVCGAAIAFGVAARRLTGRTGR
jgi:hypothetical protein